MTTNVKLIKCEVTMNQLRMAVLDKDGEPVILDKEDMFGNKYKETVEATYKRGEIISLPEAAIKKLGKSVAMVMVPQVEEPDVAEEAVPSDGEIRESGTEKTVADMIPKDIPKKAASGREPASRGKK